MPGAGPSQPNARGTRDSFGSATPAPGVAQRATVSSIGKSADCFVAELESTMMISVSA
jgi:hypothetical protein